jgi:hypothetical protein
MRLSLPFYFMVIYTRKRSSFVGNKTILEEVTGVSNISAGTLFHEHFAPANSGKGSLTRAGSTLHFLFVLTAVSVCCSRLILPALDGRVLPHHA